MLHRVRDLLILEGYQLVDVGADFVVVGVCPATPLGVSKVLEEISEVLTPVFVLSAGMGSKEEDSVNFSLGSDLVKMSSFFLENIVLKYMDAFILRVFNTYGSEESDIIRDYIALSANRKPLVVPSPGFQKSSWLYIDDFDCFIRASFRSFLEGTRGVYNLGSDEVISYKRLADSVWQLVLGTEEKAQYREEPKMLVPWKYIPDISRIKALTKIQPRSVRKGIFEVLQHA